MYSRLRCIFITKKLHICIFISSTFRGRYNRRNKATLANSCHSFHRLEWPVDFVSWLRFQNFAGRFRIMNHFIISMNNSSIYRLRMPFGATGAKGKLRVFVFGRSNWVAFQRWLLKNDSYCAKAFPTVGEELILGIGILRDPERSKLGEFRIREGEFLNMMGEFLGEAIWY